MGQPVRQSFKQVISKPFKSRSSPSRLGPSGYWGVARRRQDQAAYAAHWRSRWWPECQTVARGGGDWGTEAELQHSFPRSRADSLTHLRTHSFTHSLALLYFISWPLFLSLDFILLIYSLTHSRTHSVAHSLAHPLLSLTHSFNYSHTFVLNRFVVFNFTVSSSFSFVSSLIYSFIATLITSCWLIRLITHSFSHFVVFDYMVPSSFSISFHS